MFSRTHRGTNRLVHLQLHVFTDICLNCFNIRQRERKEQAGVWDGETEGIGIGVGEDGRTDGRTQPKLRRFMEQPKRLSVGFSVALPQK
jgi:hypothetical protein